MLDSGLWRGAVLDSNVAAQQEGVGALCAFLKYGGTQATSRYVEDGVEMFSKIKVCQI